MKKAQTEILGLVVIVILIIFALILYVMFSSQPEQTTNIKENVVLFNTLNAILKHNPICNQGTLSKSFYRIISDCTTSTQSPCPAIASCQEYVKNQLKQALDATLSPKTQYKMIIDYPESEDIVIETPEFAQCTKIMADNYPISNFVAKLSICA